MRQSLILLYATSWTSQDKAVQYLLSQADNVALWGDILQMSVLDFIRKICRQNPAEKARYLKVILALLTSTSTAVVYEAAVTLVSLSQSPTAVRAAANCFCQLLVSQSDNNVKLIVLDKLTDLKKRHKEVMQVRGGCVVVVTTWSPIDMHVIDNG